MGRQRNDGRGRLGGRQKGTPNRVTATLKEWLADLLDRNRERIEEDLEALEPRDRLAMLERLMGYVIPKCKVAEEEEAQAFPQSIEIRYVNAGNGIGVASSEEEVMRRDGLTMEDG